MKMYKNKGEKIMRKTPKYLTMINHRHGIVWWLCIGWWWRPIKYTWYLLLSSICGFRKLRIERR